MILNLQILVQRLDGNPLVRDYLAGEIHAHQFFRGPWHDRAVLADKARELDTRFHERARKRLRGFVTPTAAVPADRLERWAKAGGYLVTTGQQPGFLTGPLYSVYKALTAVRLAEALESALGKPVMALYWIASEDHDWAEANHAHLLDSSNELVTVRLEDVEGAGARPLHRLQLGDEGVRAALQLRKLLPPSEFSGPILDLISEAYRPGATPPAAFLQLLQAFLRDIPILLLDGSHPGLKEASAPILLHELEEAEAHEAALRRTAARIEAAGYPLQVPVLEGAVNLFVEGSEGRERLYRDEGFLRLRRSGVRLTVEELRDLIEEEPIRVSPNVLLRPVVESALFPTLSYVAGPGELAYFAQLGALFEAHDVGMPLVFPRHSVLLLESKIEKVLQKFRLTPDALAGPFHALVGELVREELPPSVRRALGEVRSGIGRGAGALLEAAKEIDPTLRGPVTHARNAAFSAFDEVERRILRALKRENETALAQLRKAQLHLFPLGKPQERVLNLCYYLSRYGPGLLSEVLAAFAVDLGMETA